MRTYLILITNKFPFGNGNCYMVPNFTDKTDLQQRLQTLQINTSISKQTIFEGIRKQLNE